jgi:CRP-like cAMP-binding protein
LQTAALQRFVHRLTARSILTDEEKSALLALRGQVTQVDAHADFVQLGERVDHSCLIVKGLVGRFGQSFEGTRQITGLYLRGDMADLASVVSPKSPFGLEALTATTILRVPHADLRRVATEHPGIAEALWRDCVAEGSIFSEWVINVGHRDAMSRLAHLFCEMAIRSEGAGLGDRSLFTLPLTQNDLADATGLTAVHVNRTLKELRIQGIVEVRSGNVTVPDWDRLVAAGDFDPGYMLLEGPSPRIAGRT